MGGNKLSWEKKGARYERRGCEIKTRLRCEIIYTSGCESVTTQKDETGETNNNKLERKDFISFPSSTSGVAAWVHCSGKSESVKGPERGSEL